MATLDTIDCKSTLRRIGFILILSFSHFFACYIDAAEIQARLTPHVKPLTYDVYLHPHLYNETFEGKVSILIDVLSEQDVIRLHQKDLEIISVTLMNYDGDNVEISDYYSDDETQILTVQLKEVIDAGRYDLGISFLGCLDDKVHGFYSSKYTNEDNETRIIATTHFEPNHARKAFPCFDEPSFKAEFSVRVVYPNTSGYHALSNMNVENVIVNEPSTGLNTALFAKTVPMSTYTICFIISDLVSTTKDAIRLDGSTISVSVYTTKLQKEHGKFALNTAVEIIEYYNKLFDVDFPLPKMDIVAIPDLSVHAMENWGLVTYKDKFLLYNDKNASTSNKLWTVQTIAHEFAHMWFGNLVTMKWWDELWLSEGLASYFQFKGAHATFPTSGYMDSFLKVVHKALLADAISCSHPIVEQSTNITHDLFDSVAYYKEPAVIRMLEEFIGSEVFQTGLSKYLKKFAYENTETKDLFNSIQSVVSDDINVNDIMDTWMRQAGFPVVTVKTDGLTYTLTQKIFLKNDCIDSSESPFGYRWTIPITYITSKNSTPTLVWFDKDAQNLTITLNEPVDWIKFNDRQIGFYRVNYDEEGWKALINALRQNHEQFTIHDRAHLLEDAFSLAEAEKLNYATALDLTLYLNKEVNYMPWFVASEKLNTLSRRLSNSEISTKFYDYIKNLVDNAYYSIKWNVEDEDTINDLLFRTTVLNFACSFEHDKCLEDAGDIFKAWIYDGEDVRPHPDIREIVYKYGMKYGGNETAWDIMFDRFIAENNADERKILTEGLISLNSESTSILNKSMSLIFDQRYFSCQDTYSFLEHFNQNRFEFVWNWIQENWEYLKKRYSSSELLYYTLIPYYRLNADNKAKLDEAETFLLQHSVQEETIRVYRSYAEDDVQQDKQWMEGNLVQIDRWLNIQTDKVILNVIDF